MKKRERVARDRLYRACQRIEAVRGQAGFYEGYRTGGRDSEEMYEKMMAAWCDVEDARKEFDRAFTALLRVVRQEARRAQG